MAAVREYLLSLVRCMGPSELIRSVAITWRHLLPSANVNTSGVFQAYYETDLLHSSSPSSISWIGSLQLCIFIAGTSVMGPIYDIGFLRTVLSVGTFLTVFGLMMTSLCKAYWQFILAQGICTGLGMTCLFVPCVAVLPPWFPTRRALAMGIAATGSSIGELQASEVVFSWILTTGQERSCSPSYFNRQCLASALAGRRDSSLSSYWSR